MVRKNKRFKITAYLLIFLMILNINPGVINVQAAAVPVEQVIINERIFEMEKGSQHQLSASYTPENANTNTTKEWISSDEEIATVDQNGLVTAIETGDVEITVKCGDVESSPCKISVVISPSQLTLDNHELRLSKGQAKTLKANLLPSNATTTGIVWKSSNEKVATVDKDGKVKAEGTGRAEITATCRGQSDKCTVIITAAVEKVTLDHENVVIEKGTKLQLNMDYSPDDATNANSIVWTSSDEDVATVEAVRDSENKDKGGVVTAKEVGTTTITVTCGNREARCNVTVAIGITKLDITQDKVNLKRGQSIELTLETAPADTTDTVKTWKSSNENVVKVDQNGKVTAVGAGSANVTVSCGGLTSSCSFNVTVPVTEFSLDPVNLEIKKGTKYQLNAVYYPSDATNATISWKTSDEKIATVDEDGMLKAISSGNVEITAICGGITEKCNVTVFAPVEKLTFEKSEINLEIGKTVSMPADYFPYDATNVHIIYKTSDNRVAVVDQDGNITANKKGIAIITAENADVKTECKVNVTEEDLKVTGLYKQNDGCYYYFVNGSIDRNYTGLVEWEDDLYYVSRGVVTNTFTGAVSYEDRMWFVKDGLVVKDYTGIGNDGKDTWYFNNGSVDTTYNGVYSNDTEGAYIVNGKMDKSFNGFASNNDGKWFVENGVIDVSYTGIVLSGTERVYLTKGKLDTEFKGFVEYDDGMWYVADGKVDPNYGGAVYIDNKWRYVTGGKQDNTYTGMAYTGTEWLYFDTGNVDWLHHGLEYADGEWVYFEDGRVNYAYTGFASNDFGWWYVRNGKIDFNYCAYIQNDTDWWPVNHGKLDFEYTGLAESIYGLVFLENGQISEKATGLFELNGVWSYYTNGQVDTAYTGLASNEYGWWYVNEGQVDFGYFGVVENESGWWVVYQGQVNFDYTGLAQNEYGWWYINDGWVNFDYTGLVPNEYGWWIVYQGQVNFDYTGLAENEYGWWYINDGWVNFDYTGLVPNESGWWYVNDGRVNFDYTGLAQNENGWWYINDGWINFDYTGLVPNEYGWWYVNEGQVNFDYTGLAENENGWWYVNQGQIDFGYTGIVENESGKWYIVNGKIDFNYNGSIESENKKYNIVNGMVR